MFVKELSDSIETIRGLSTATAAKYRRLGVFTVADLLLLKPRAYEDMRSDLCLKDFKRGKVYCRVSILNQVWFGKPGKKTLKLIARDDEGSTAELLCFNRDFLARSFPEGSAARIYRDFSWKYEKLQSSSFSIEKDDESSPAYRGIRPVYPLTAGLTNRLVFKHVRSALEKHLPVEDEIPPSIGNARLLIGKADALAYLHSPPEPALADAARKRLAYEELFYFELLVLRRSLLAREYTKPRTNPDGNLTEAFRSRLPFSLTNDQEKAIQEIKSDLSRPWPMTRLLQGDVGSGKTLVAFFAMLLAAEQGGQAALLCPTELLARQHAETAARLLEPLGIRLALFTGSVDAKARKPLMAALENGDIDVVIGTHALFSDDVVYNRLSLIVIDEQHRFGVLQRLALSEKAAKPDVLLMSATPIPRTLSLTVYGDLSVSTIVSMPPGRKPITTHLVQNGNESRVYDFVKKELQNGRQAYFVYPMIEESRAMSLKSASEMHKKLAALLSPFKGGLIHSRMADEDALSVMRAFEANELSFLVSTTIVEVGVDVANATCMVIEHAERFGLAALHQLRGRIGRGSFPSYCFLVWSEPLTEEAKQRLKVMKESTDGFEIAEQDLAIRGPGDIAGTAQSGLLDFTFADPIRDTELLEAARADAAKFLGDNPGLTGPDGELVRAVLTRATPFKEALAARS